MDSFYIILNEIHPEHGTNEEYIVVRTSYIIINISPSFLYQRTCSLINIALWRFLG